MKTLLAEFKRRNVYKVAVAYAVVAWLLIQAASILFPTFEAPTWVMKVFVAAVAAGFPISLVIAWAFELTPEGLKRTEAISADEPKRRWSRRKFIGGVGVVAVLAGGLLMFQLLRPKHSAIPSTNGKSIAVLPFASLSEDKANAYFADGIQDEILTRLSKIAELKVISRTSTQQYQSKPGNLSEIAKQLGVAHILEGSVQKSGDSVRVNVQLIKAEGDSHLWAETYDRKLTDIFTVESEVAQRIASSLEARLSGREQKEVADIPTKNPEAYDAYLRGLASLNQQGFEPIERAIEYLRKAVELDPQYAQAWAQLGIAESQKSGYERTGAQLERARVAAETAVRLQPDLAETHEGLATYYYYALRDFDHALLELEQAQSRDPNNAEVLLYTGLIKRRQGKLDESIEYQRKATVFDPRNSDIWTNLGGSYRGKRDFKTAREMLDRALAISPDELDLIGYKTETYTAEGNLDAADAVLRGHQLKPGTEALYQQTYSLVCRRQFDEAIKSFAATEDAAATLPPIMKAMRKTLLAELHSFAGHTSEARQMLEQARRDLTALRTEGNTSSVVLDGLVQCDGFLGDRQELDREAEALLKQTAPDKWQYGLSEQTVAGAYSVIGAADRALPFIEHALSVNCDTSLTVVSLRQSPVWDRIRDDPRFQKIAGEGR